MNPKSTIPLIPETYPTRKAYGRAIASALLSLVIGYIAFTGIFQPHTFAIRENGQAILLALLLAGFVFWRVLVLSSLGKIILTTLSWGITWGVVAAAVAIVLITINPDTGHIPPEGMVFIFGVLSAAFGLFAGFLFAAVLAILELKIKLGFMGRGILGVSVGGGVGILLMNYDLHTYFTVLLAAVTSLSLAISFSKSNLQNFHNPSN